MRGHRASRQSTREDATLAPSIRFCATTYPYDGVSTRAERVVSLGHNELGRMHEHALRAGRARRIDAAGA